MNITLELDSNAAAAPQSFISAIQTAASILDGTVSDNINLNITVGYGEIDGSALSSGSAEGGADAKGLDSYSQVRSWLAANAATDVQSGIAALPVAASVQGVSQIEVFRAQAKLDGELSPTDPGVDGSIGFAKDVPQANLIGVAMHEIAHAMGRILADSTPTIFDLFRYVSAGLHQFSPIYASAGSYFSLNGGKTDSGDFSTDPGDFLASTGRTTNDDFNSTYNASTYQYLSSLDLLVLESLGFHVAQQTAAGRVQQVHANDLGWASTASGANHFIDLLNFEASFSDLTRAFGTNQAAMQAWYGANEPREGRVETFDGLDYVASYGDLIAAFKAAGSVKGVEDLGATHFIQSGLNEGRSTTFNGLDYIASYGDLIKALGINGDAGAYHYIESGAAEGRTTSFDGLDYIASYGDLIKALGANEQAGAAQFIANGSGEGRTTSFDGLSYIANYTDLMRAFGANDDAGAAHYINSGSREGRATTFDVGGYIQAHPDLMFRFANNDQFLSAYITTYATTGTFLT